MSITILESGESIRGNDQTIRSDGPIDSIGDDNLIYTNHSEIRGNCNNVFGDNNIIRGDYNMIVGKGNIVFGIENKLNPPTQLQPIAATKSILFPNWHRLEQVQPVPQSIPIIPPNWYQLAQSQPIQLSKPIAQNPVIQEGNRTNKFISDPIHLKYPTKEEVKYDEPVEEKDVENACVICMESKRKCVIYPCKHFCLCIACSNNELKLCPVCRIEINNIERLFT